MRAPYTPLVEDHVYGEDGQEVAMRIVDADCKVVLSRTSLRSGDPRIICNIARQLMLLGIELGACGLTVAPIVGSVGDALT